MRFEVLQELQRRGRFFFEMFPGAKVSDDWQRHRDLLNERHRSPKQDPERSGFKEPSCSTTQ